MLAKYKKGDRVKTPKGEGIIKQIFFPKKDSRIPETFYEVKFQVSDKKSKSSDFLESNIELIEAAPDMKFDSGKIRFSLLVPEFIEEMIKVMEFGAKKYAPDSWKTIDKVRYQDAEYRHYTASLKEDLDPESGLSHKAHQAVNAMFVYYLTKEKK